MCHTRRHLFQHRPYQKGCQAECSLAGRRLSVPRRQGKQQPAEAVCKHLQAGADASVKDAAAATSLPTSASMLRSCCTW